MIIGPIDQVLLLLEILSVLTIILSDSFIYKLTLIQNIIK